MIRVKVGQHEIAWPPFLFILTVHAAALSGLFCFSWQALGVCMLFYWLTAGLGISLGFHRLLTHHSFTVPRPLLYFFAFLGSLACQAGPITWVTAHRLHHEYADREGDPHSPIRSFFWAHMGWCVVKKNQIYDPKVQSVVAKELVRDRGMVFLQRTFVLWNVVLGAALYAWGGWPFVVWGIFVRLVLTYHGTWLINSAAHTWGSQRYATGDRSRNLWWLAPLTFGEGWHNNHHAFLNSARHGHKWWEVDVTYYTIRLLSKLHLASAIHLPQPNNLTAADI